MNPPEYEANLPESCVHAAEAGAACIQTIVSLFCTSGGYIRRGEWQQQHKNVNTGDGDGDADGEGEGDGDGGDGDGDGDGDGSQPQPQPRPASATACLSVGVSLPQPQPASASASASECFSFLFCFSLSLSLGLSLPQRQKLPQECDQLAGVLGPPQAVLGPDLSGDLGGASQGPMVLRILSRPSARAARPLWASRGGLPGPNVFTYSL